MKARCYDRHGVLRWSGERDWLPDSIRIPEPPPPASIADDTLDVRRPRDRTYRRSELDREVYLEEVDDEEPQG